MADTATPAESGSHKKHGHGKSVEKATPEEVEEVKAAEAAPDKTNFYIKRCGYGNMVFYEGEDAKGTPAYYVEVARKLVGWDITLRRGGDKTGEPILHLRKAVRFLSLLGWDKGSKMTVKSRKSGEDGSFASKTSGTDTSYPGSTTTDGAEEDEEGERAPEELNPSYDHDDAEVGLTQDDKHELDNELTQSMKQLKLSGAQVDPDTQKPLCVLQRKHAFRSNRNVFEYNGQTYAWDYKIFIGALHTLKNLDTGEIVAICQLKPGVTTQSITAWGLRQNGKLEIMGAGHQMQDMIVATLIGMLEWRKHNNKVWIILLAAMPA